MVVNWVVSLRSYEKRYYRFLINLRVERLSKYPLQWSSIARIFFRYKSPLGFILVSGGWMGPICSAHLLGTFDIIQINYRDILCNYKTLARAKNKHLTTTWEKKTETSFSQERQKGARHVRQCSIQERQKYRQMKTKFQKNEFRQMSNEPLLLDHVSNFFQKFLSSIIKSWRLTTVKIFLFVEDGRRNLFRVDRGERGGATVGCQESMRLQATDHITVINHFSACAICEIRIDFYFQPI